VLGFHRFVAGVHQQEAAGAVGVLGLAGFHAHLAEQRRLLVTGDTADGDAALGAAVDLRRGLHFRQHFARNVEDLQHLRIPLQGVDVEEHGARGVGVIGDVGFAAGKFPDQPAVHGAEQQFAVASALTAAFDVIEDPLELGTGKVRVGDQAGGVVDVLLVAITLELLADLGAAAALPYDGVVDRAAGDFVPHYGGFTLVGDTDGGDLVVVQAGLCQGFDHHRALGSEDFHRVMFNPPRLWVVLSELTLGGADHVGVTIEDDCPGTGGALIKGNDVVLILNVGHVDCLGREIREWINSLGH